MAFDQPISLPQSVQELKLGGRFNQQFRLPEPNSLKSIIFGNDYKLPIPAALQHLTKLVVGRGFRGEMSLVPSLEELTLNSNTNLTKLPTTLRKLHCNGDFYLPLDNLSSLTKLSLNGGFNRPVVDLPETLTILNINGPFNHPLDCLPPNLTHLTTGESFNHPLENLPLSLTHIFIGASFNHQLDFLPPSLISLKISSYSSFNDQIDHLPQSLKTLCLGNKFNTPIVSLPVSLNFIEFGDHFNQPITTLPPYLTNLYFGYDFDQPLPALPATLGVLGVKENYSYPLVDLIPLRVLRIDKPGNTKPKQTLIASLSGVQALCIVLWDDKEVAHCKIFVDLFRQRLRISPILL